MFRQPEWKTSSESSEYLLSLERSEAGSYKLIGQFCRDVIGCKTQVVQVGCHWSVSVHR